MGLKQTVAPTGEPVSTADAKTHLRYDSSDSDAYIDTLVATARGLVEAQTGRQLIKATFEQRMDAFPNSTDAIFLAVAPLNAFTQLDYTDGDGASQTWAASKYDVDTGSDHQPGRIKPAYGEVWPGTRKEINAVTLTYDAGYANAAAVPVDLVHAVKLLVGHWWANRESVVLEQGMVQLEVKQAFESLISGWIVQDQRLAEFV
jgi:uncharacterized phiE125 gp8 family phage protein